MAEEVPISNDEYAERLDAALQIEDDDLRLAALKSAQNDWNGGSMSNALLAKDVSSNQVLQATRDNDISRWALGTATEVITDPAGQPQPGFYPIRITRSNSIRWFPSIELLETLMNKGDRGIEGASEGELFALAGGTAAADPGNGKIKFNADHTEIYLDNLNEGGEDVTAWIDSMDDQPTAVRLQLKIRQLDTTKVATLNVVGEITSATSYRIIPVALVGDWPEFTTGARLAVIQAFTSSMMSEVTSATALAVEKAGIAQSAADSANTATTDAVSATAAALEVVADSVDILEARDESVNAATSAATLAAALADMRTTIVGLTNMPVIYDGNGLAVQPTAVSFDLYVIAGYYTATGLPYRPLDPIETNDVVGNLSKVVSSTIGMVNCPTVTVGGRVVQPVQLSFDLYVVRGIYLDTLEIYDPSSPDFATPIAANTSAIALLNKTTLGMANCPTVTVEGREVQPTELSFDLYVMRGTYTDTGDAYEPLAASAPLTPVVQRVVDLWEMTIECPPISFGGRMLQPLELSFDLYVQRGIYLDTGEHYDPMGSAASAGGGLIVVQTPTRLRMFRKGLNPASNLFVEHQFDNTPDSAKNSDVFRLTGTWECLRTATYEFTRVQQICQGGEYETAIQELGAIDFMGGNAHGNQEKFATLLVVNGVGAPVNRTLNFQCDTLEFFQASHIYQVGNPDKYVPKGTNLADVFTRWRFDDAGYDLWNVVQWKVSVTLAICYLTMLPIERISSDKGTQITTAGIKSPTYELEDISTSSHSGTNTKSDNIKLWGETGYGAEVQILDGWDKPNRRARISNSAAPAYNKLYFDYTGSGYVTTVGEEMRAHARVVVNTTN